MRWASKRKSYMSVLDIGTSKVCCLVLRMNADERPEVVGMGLRP